MVNYNNFAKTFSQSRRNMKWEEIEYFISSYLESVSDKNILDIGCGNGRFLGVLKSNLTESFGYLGIDLSEGLLQEAKNLHTENEFKELNMTQIDILGDKKYEYIFFIASFHHLNKIEERKKVLQKAYHLLKDGGKIIMTNWALNSELNKKKYTKSQIINSQNEFGSIDYNIKIGEFDRYYHCFSLEELKYLFTESGFKIIENRLFDNQRNFVSVIEKK